MSKFFSLLFVVLFSNFVFAQANYKSEIKKIDAYCKSVNSFVKKYKKPHLIFADVSQTEKAKWRKFASEKALEKFRENTETYSISYNWERHNKIIQSNFTLFSESGDWTTSVNYSFRQNGTLAKIEFEHRTFYGNFVALQNFYFNDKGNFLKKTVKYLDLYTNKPKTMDLKTIDNRYLEVDFYRKTNSLPFAFLLSKK